MGLGQLKDAVVRERRRRLLGEDMVAVVRRPRRARLGSLVDGELQTRSHLAATTTSEEVVGLQQVKQQSGWRLCPGPEEQEDALLQVEGPDLCSNMVAEGRRDPHAQLTGAALIDGGGGCQTHHRAVTATSKETRAQETLRTGFNTSASAVARIAKTMVEQTLLQVEHTPGRAATTPSEEVGGLETLIPGQHTDLVLSSSASAGKFNKVDSQDSDSDDNDSMMMPIFVRHGSGELTCTVRMDQSTEDLMQLYSQRTKTTLDSQYFVYERKKLKPHHTWLSYGLKRDTTVHVCTRLLGGADGQNLQDYINDNRQNFVQVVPLHDGRFSLQMTPIGCQFLSSWIRCLTKAFISGKSWDGKFELVDFKFVEGHVRYIKRATKHINSSSVGADVTKFADEVEKILLINDMQNLVSRLPPYVEACMRILRGLVATGLAGRLSCVVGPLPQEYKLFLDTLVCCMTSNARGRLIIELFRKYEGADEKEAILWRDAINGATCPRRKKISKNATFNYFIQRRSGAGKPYSSENTGAFTLMRDVVMHAADRNQNPNAPQLGDGTELMIPATLEEFLPGIIKNLIEKNIDISAELLEAIRCACSICDSSH